VLKKSSKNNLFSSKRKGPIFEGFGGKGVMLFGVIVWFVLSYLSSILYAYGAHTIKDIIA